MEQPLSLGPLNEGSGIPFFHFDREFGAFFLCARGDNNIGVWHLDKSKDQMLTCQQNFPFPSSTQKAFTIGPKYCVNVGKQEVMRAVRATSQSKIEVLQMIIPSRIGGFNQGYYPPFAANEPSNEAEQWCAGTDVQPKTMQLTAEASKTKGKK